MLGMFHFWVLHITRLLTCIFSWPLCHTASTQDWLKAPPIFGPKKRSKAQRSSLESIDHLETAPSFAEVFLFSGTVFGWGAFSSMLLQVRWDCHGIARWSISLW